MFLFKFLFKFLKERSSSLRWPFLAKAGWMAAWVLTLGIVEFISFSAPSRAFGSVSVTLLHTNDLHSHFRPDRDPLQLGGIARLKTAIDQIKRNRPHTLVLDGGDWSEGNIYYTEQGGAETLRMMDRLGYDVAVVGNHDWINGPDTLLKMLGQAHPKMALVSANLDPENYPQAETFRRMIAPYVIRKIKDIKIAFIGISTYEYIYDKFALPLTILHPEDVLQELVPKLREEEGADAVVVISHNGISTNTSLLDAVPGIDLIIGAHDHKKLTQPIVVEREGGSPGWLVEAGSWGQYLGRVDLRIKKGSAKLMKYQLLQMDSKIPEDPEINQSLEEMESRIEAKFGPIFHDHIGDSQVENFRVGVENRMGNLVTDAYLKATGADLALDSTKFIYGEIHRGPIRSVDVFNANPAVFNPEQNRTWTLKTLPITGRLLKWLLYGMYSTSKLSSYGLLSSSGIEFTYDPFFAKYNLNVSTVLQSPIENQLALGQRTMGWFDGIANVSDIQIQGQPLEADRTYQVATGGGLIEAIEFFNSYSPIEISLKGLKDTAQENWRVLKDYLVTLSSLTTENVPRGDRIKTKESDLGIFREDIQWEPIRKTADGVIANIRVQVRNYGVLPSLSGSKGDGPRIELLGNRNGNDFSIDPEYFELGKAYPIRSLNHGETEEFIWERVKIPEDLQMYSVTLRISGNDNEVNQTDNQVTRHFRPDEFNQ